MKKVLLFVLLIPVLMLAAAPNKAGDPVLNSPYNVTSTSVFSATANAMKYIYAWNGLGDTIRQYSVVVWDTTQVLLDSAKYNGSGSFAVADTHLTSRPWTVYFEVVGTADACTCSVVGYDSTGYSQTKTVILNGLNDMKFVAGLWRKVTSMSYKHATQDTIRVRKVPYFTVTTSSTIYNTLIAGVTIEKSYSNTLVPICVEGLTPVLLLGTSQIVLPGEIIANGSTAGWGICLPVAIPTTALGEVLESGNTNKAYLCRIHVNP